MRNPRAATRTVTRRKVRGLSLIELMIALVLGLVVVGAAGGVFLANRRVYAASETLNRVQENGRVSFELMARDLREAGGNPCGSSFDAENGGFVNMLRRSSDTDWRSAIFMSGIRGTEAGAADSVDLALTGEGGLRRIVDASTPASHLEVDDATGINEGDLVLACNSQKAILFEVRGLTGNDRKIRYNKGGNCASTLLADDPGLNCKDIESNGSPAAACFSSEKCKGWSAQPYTDASGKKVFPPAYIVSTGGVRWHIADNGRGGTSLYRARLNGATGDWTVVDRGEEIAEGVSELQLRYRRANAPELGFKQADEIPPGDWDEVNAVEVAITTVGVAGSLSRSDIEGTDKQPLRRTFTYVVALRNRENGA